jgi:transposase InsO family protein
MYILAVIEHASRRIRIRCPRARNLAMGLQDTRSNVRYLIRDRDGKYPAMFDTILADAGITVVRSGVQMPRMNAIIERVGADLPPRAAGPYVDLEPEDLRYALREFETFYNEHRAHQGIANARPLTPLPEPITDPDRLARLTIHRHDRLGGVLWEYKHAA